jgi:hypothetical protein
LKRFRKKNIYIYITRDIQSLFYFTLSGIQTLKIKDSTVTVHSFNSLHL